MKAVPGSAKRLVTNDFRLLENAESVRRRLLRHSEHELKRVDFRIRMRDERSRLTERKMPSYLFRGPIFHIEPAMEKRLVLAAQPLHRVRVAPHDVQEVLRPEIAAKVQAPDRGGEVERCPAEALPQRPRRAQPVPRRGFLKRGVAVFADEAGRSRGVAAAYAPGLEDDRLDPGRGERPRRRASGEPAANNDDVGIGLTAEAGIVGTAAFRVAVEPERGVSRHRLSRTCG